VSEVSLNVAIQMRKLKMTHQNNYTFGEEPEKHQIWRWPKDLTLYKVGVPLACTLWVARVEYHPRGKRNQLIRRQSSNRNNSSLAYN
jgi:hypothetical protein